MLGFAKRKKLCGGLWVCLKFSLRILKHSKNNDDNNDDDDDDDNNNSNNNILWHSTAHSDLLPENFEDKLEFQFIRKVTMMTLLFLRTSSLMCITISGILSVFGHPECPELVTELLHSEN
jgi:hypothetical protein